MDGKTLLQFLLLKLLRNDTPFFCLFAKQWISKDIQTGANQNARKWLSTDLVNINDDYFHETKCLTSSYNFYLSYSGFLYMDVHVTSLITDVQYLAPLMAYFNPSLSVNSTVLTLDDGELVYSVCLTMKKFTQPTEIQLSCETLVHHSAWFKRIMLFCYHGLFSTSSFKQASDWMVALPVN